MLYGLLNKLSCPFVYSNYGMEPLTLHLLSSFECTLSVLGTLQKNKTSQGVEAPKGGGGGVGDGS